MAAAGMACAPAVGRRGQTEPARAEPTPIAPDQPLTRRQQAWVERTLAALSLRERVGQMVFVWVLGDYTHADDPSFTAVRRWITTDRVGGMTMSLGSPIEVAAKVDALQRLAPVPLLVSSDLEPALNRLVGGVFLPYMMTGGSATVFPSNMAIGASGRESDAYAAGRVIGREARAVGITVVFAPTVDVNSNPANPVINTRSFGEDAQAVAGLSAAFVRGLQDAGVVATAKHFPGHGDTDTDSHLALPVVQSDRNRLDRVELVPFRAAIEARVGAIMTAHIALPALGQPATPATLAPEVVDGLLRDSLGFDGLIFTDALSMEGIGQGYTVERSAVLAVQAGADVLLKPGSVTAAIDAVVGAVERGEIAAERIAASTRRILALKARLGLDQRPRVDLDALRSIVGAPDHWRVATDIAARAITLLRDSAALVPVAPTGRVTVVTYAPELELLAGRAFAAEVRAQAPGATFVRIGPATSADDLALIGSRIAGHDHVIVTTHVRTIEGEGRSAIAPHVATWIDEMATRYPVVLVANGNPYVIRQMPRVGSYVATFGIDPSLERAAARALFGAAPFLGRSPISLPGFFTRGAGLRRESAQ